MKAVYSFLTLSFLPKSQDLGLLLLRLVLGMGMLVLHGWAKLMLFLGTGGWSGVAVKTRTEALNKLAQNVDVFHFGHFWCLGALIFAEVICSLLVVVGLCTRFAALVLAFAMGVAFFAKHGHSPYNLEGELVVHYLVGFSVLIVTGPGAVSMDGHSSSGGSSEAPVRGGGGRKGR